MTKSSVHLPYSSRERQSTCRQAVTKGLCSSTSQHPRPFIQTRRPPHEDHDLFLSPHHANQQPQSEPAYSDKLHCNFGLAHHYTHLPDQQHCYSAAIASQRFGSLRNFALGPDTFLLPHRDFDDAMASAAAKAPPPLPTSKDDINGT